MQFFPTLVSVIAAVASVASAKPVKLVRDVAGKPVSDIVVAPGFYEPAGGETYTAGSTQTAEWDTSVIPSEAQNYTGALYLGYSTSDSSSEHLDITHPLAAGFLLTDGQVAYTIPKNITARSTYFLVLVGDSGNTSPVFSIVSA